MQIFSVSEIISYAITVVTAVVASIITFAVWTGKVDERLDGIDDGRKKSDETDQRIDVQLHALTITLEKIGVALWGIDGRNGLRGELKEVKAEIKELRQDLTDYRNR